jgi:hypothetical protein
VEDNEADVPRLVRVRGLRIHPKRDSENLDRQTARDAPFTGALAPYKPTLA